MTYRNLPLRPLLLLGLTLAGAAAALTVVSLNAQRTYRTLEAAAGQRQMAYDFLMALRQLRQHVGEIRVGLTGYAATRDPLYRATYAGAIDAFPTDIAALRRLSGDQPTLRSLVDDLEAAAADYADQMRAAMDAAERGASAALGAEFQRRRDTVLIERARNAIVAVEKEQIQLMDTASRELAQAVARSKTGITTVLIVSMLLVLGAGGAAVAHLLGREMEKRARESASLLAERGRELEHANRELDSFASSISHDLRAPLRAIDGFSQILVEDYGSHLDAEATRIVGVIRANTQKMGQLIDDLLAFSRLGRQPIGRAPLDMTELVRVAIEDVSAHEPQRNIDFRMGALPSTVGDRSLLKQVWINLLTNGVKYTRPREAAVIEIEGTLAAGEAVYTVKDNGVGFDMRYAAQLFGVFQRLHSASEFEGTGVGLAIVRRIVERHGGRVWAEGRVGEGAAFSFALPAQKSGQAANLPIASNNLQITNQRA